MRKIGSFTGDKAITIATDVIDEDPGYFVVYDTLKDRDIFICCQEVGASELFWKEHDIKYVLKIPACIDDTHFIEKNKREKSLYFDQMVHVVQLLLSTDENIVIYCRRGRSRSPSFVAAYFVVIECFSAQGAYSYLSEKFTAFRFDRRGIDRDCRFLPHLSELVEKLNSLNDQSIFEDF